jgi:hypothetical protein
VVAFSGSIIYQQRYPGWPKPETVSVLSFARMNGFTARISTIEWKGKSVEMSYTLGLDLEDDRWTNYIPDLFCRQRPGIRILFWDSKHNPIEEPILHDVPLVRGRIVFPIRDTITFSPPSGARNVAIEAGNHRIVTKTIRLPKEP